MVNDMDENAIVGQRLKRIRKSLKITQAQMGEKLGKSPSSYNEIEKGKVGISTKMYIKLSELFNVNLNFLVNGRGEMFYSPEPEFNSETVEYTFDKNIDSREKLMYMMKKSTFFCHSVLALAQEFYHKKGSIIREMLEEQESE